MGFSFPSGVFEHCPGVSFGDPFVAQLADVGVLVDQEIEAGGIGVGAGGKPFEDQACNHGAVGAGVGDRDGRPRCAFAAQEHLLRSFSGVLQLPPQAAHIFVNGSSADA